MTDEKETAAEAPSSADATEQASALPENFQNDGEEIVAGLQKLIEGKSVLTVSTALVATLYAAVTQPTLDRQAKEALSLMVNDLAANVLATNEIGEERLQVLMAQRGGVEVQASAHGALLLDVEPEQG